MSGFIYQSGHDSGAWKRYIDREHAARNAYLQTTQGAWREYLTGPWPDREAYNAVEMSAWSTYYAAGRSAWRTYTQEITPPPPPPADHGATTSYGPLPPIDGPNSGPWPNQPSYTPNQEGRSLWPHS